MLFSLNIEAQRNPIDKTYSAEISTGCKEFKDGGCTLYTYCFLSFEKDSVNISYNQYAFCSPKEQEAYYTKENYNGKRYSWTRTNGQIEITGFYDYGILSIKKDSLLGQIQKNRVEKMLFVLNPAR